MEAKDLVVLPPGTPVEVHDASKGVHAKGTVDHLGRLKIGAYIKLREELAGNQFSLVPAIPIYFDCQSISYPAA